jgi:hypothetical protein
MLAMVELSHGGLVSETASATQLASDLVSKERTMGSDFKVKIFTKKFLVLDFFFFFFCLWGGFLSLGHCLVKTDIE